MEVFFSFRFNYASSGTYVYIEVDYQDRIHPCAIDRKDWRWRPNCGEVFKRHFILSQVFSATLYKMNIVKKVKQIFLVCNIYEKRF